MVAKAGDAAPRRVKPGDGEPAGPRRFRPGLASTLVVILLFPALIGLGLWQLDRADQKRRLFTEVNALRDAPPLVLTKLEGAALETQLGRAVSMRGRYREPQFLLDNRVRGQVAGYEVLTPFELVEGGVLLVNRGWIPAGADRARAPPTPAGGLERQLGGRLGRPPSTGLRLSDGDLAERLGAQVFRIQHVEREALARRLGFPLSGVLVYLGDAQEDGYDRHWPELTADVSKHQAYATQWFAMAAVLLLLYFRINLRHTGTQ